MSNIRDWSDVGLFPLQDIQRGVPTGARQTLAGCRIRRINDDGDDPRDSLIVVAGEEGMGTVGDIHPWLFIQTSDRAKRGMGSWAQGFAGTTDRGGTGGTRESHPIFGSRYEPDRRYSRKAAPWPEGLPELPKGLLVNLFPNSDETSPHMLYTHGDPRLFSANAGGKATMATLVVDFQPDEEPCMDMESGLKPRKDGPGIQGRAARLHSFLRVIAVDPKAGIPGFAGKGNALAWNLSTADIDGLWGHGACFGPLSGGQTGPPITGQSQTSQTPSAPGAFGGGADPGSDHGPPLPPPSLNSRGKWERKARGGHGIALMANAGGSGPFHLGSEGDKHRIGVDRDGHPINAGHLSVDAYWYLNPRKDGPMLFEPQPFPDCKDFDQYVHVHLVWDDTLPHPFIKGRRMGRWRWYTTTHCCDPDPPTTGPPFNDPPTGPPTPGPPTPGPPTPRTPNPGNPTVPSPDAPTTPRPGPKTPGGDQPTTPRTGPRTGPPTTGPVTPRPAPPLPPDKRGPFTHPRGPIGPPPEPPSTGPIEPPPGATPREGQRVPPKKNSRVGSIDAGDIGLWSLLHYHSSGFGEIVFRPQLMVEGAPDFLHAKGWTDDQIRTDEARRPTVLALRAFGDQLGNDWNYAQQPNAARARGGTAWGGILLTPPQFILEDYLGINTKETATTLRSGAQQGYFMAAPQVAYALGVPNVDGTLNPKSVVIRQDQSDTTNDQLLIEQLDSAATATAILKTFVQQSDGAIKTRLNGNLGIDVDAGSTNKVEIEDNATTASVLLKVTADDASPYGIIVGNDTFSTTDTEGLALWTSDAGGATVEARGTASEIRFFTGAAERLTIENGGDVSVLSALALDDNIELKFGTGDDATIDYDGTNLVVAITAGDLQIAPALGDVHVVGASLELDDNESVTLGTGKDATILYNGSDVVINPAAVGTGDVKITGGSVHLEDSEALVLGTGEDATISYNGTDLVISPAAVGAGDVVISGGSLELADSEALRLGGAQDALIYYDGTDLIIDPDAVGTGSVKCEGPTWVNDRFGVFVDPGTTNRAEINCDAFDTVGLKVTTGSAFPWAFVVGNDAWSTTDSDGIAMFVGDSAGDCNIYANGTGAYLAFFTSSTERLRIENGGAVLVLSQLALQDNINLTFGTGDDASIDYDGSDLIIAPAVVGTGDVKITGGSVHFEDNEGAVFGTGEDATIVYNGTNLVINPDAVGTGDCEIAGDLHVNSGFGVGVSPGAVNLAEVSDTAWTGSVILKVTCDDANPYGIVVGNDTFSTTDTDGFAVWVDNSGEVQFEARGTGAAMQFLCAGANVMAIDTSGDVYIDDTLAVGQAAAADAAAVLELESTTKGFLLPRMTNTQQNNITSPPDGLVIYNTTAAKITVRAGGAWEEVTSS